MIVTKSVEAPPIDVLSAEPFRPLFVESKDMKVTYELTDDEIKEAVLHWLTCEHEIDADFVSPKDASLSVGTSSQGQKTLSVSFKSRT